jgi:hypothetical protein
MAAGATYEPIATQTLASAATSITFSSIAATYTDLRIVLVMSGSSTARNPRFYFNTDTATNYSYLSVYGNGTAAGSFATANDNRILFQQNSAPSTTIPSLFTADIFSYAGSTNKTVLCSGSTDSNGAGSTERLVGLWRSTAAITQIVVDFASATTFSIGTTATLYGIKAA